MNGDNRTQQTYSSSTAVSQKYKSTTEAYNYMYIHRLKVIMYVYDVSASYRLDLAIFLEILILFSFVEYPLKSAQR